MNEKRKWQIKMLDIAKELQYLLDQYDMRKSKCLRYAPTDRELKHAIEMYKFLLEDAEKGIESSIKLLEILNDMTDNTEEKIKVFGFLDESMTKYPDGRIPKDEALDIAEKWDVLNYIVEDIIRVLGIRLYKT